MKQYEIWWADLPAPAGRRPVLLLTRNAGYEYLNRVTVVEVTSTIRNIPQEVMMGTREGLPKPCVANLDNIHALAKTRLSQRIGSLAANRVASLKRALGYALGWAELKDVDSNV